MTAEHVQWGIGLASVFVLPPIVYHVWKRLQKPKAWICPMKHCQKVFEDKLDLDEHFRAQHLRGPR